MIKHRRRWLAVVLVVLALAVLLPLLLIGSLDSPTNASTTCATGSVPRVEVGGLSPKQADNGATIVGVGQQTSMTPFGEQIAVAVAMQESQLLNIASSGVPESEQFPNDGVRPPNYDSVGIFQQRASWGTVEQRMTVTVSAYLFYRALVKVKGWQQMALTDAAQAVQGSAYPKAYAKWATLAQQVVAKTTGVAPPTDCLAQDFPVVGTGKVAVAIAHALLAVGTSYSFGGSCADPHSADMSKHCDCSSLVQSSWGAAGVALPRTSEAQYASSKTKLLGDVTAANVAAKAQPGWLLWYEWGEDGIPGPGHVALSLGNGYLIEAPQPGEDVHVIPIYQAGFVGASVVVQS